MSKGISQEQRTASLSLPDCRGAGGIPKGSANLRDQLRRASESILLNLAEGSGGKPGSLDRKRFNRHEAGSGMECAAAWKIIRIRGIAGGRIRDRARTLLRSIVAMLLGMSG